MHDAVEFLERTGSPRRAGADMTWLVCANAQKKKMKLAVAALVLVLLALAVDAQKIPVPGGATVRPLVLLILHIITPT